VEGNSWGGVPDRGREGAEVVFASYFECGFNLPVGDFFRRLLYYYKLELVDLVPNSITVVSTLCTSVRHIWDIASLSSVEAPFLCKDHWQEIGASGGCDVLLEVGPQVRVDRQ
jgi:hypothetical protein